MLLRRLLLLLPVFLFSTLTLQAQQAPKQPNYKKKGAVIPPFVIKRTDGSTFSNAQLRAGVPTVLFLFPSCEHCEKVIDSLRDQADQFRNAQFVFVAEERQRPYMQDFLTRTAIRKTPFFKNMGFDAGNLIYFLYEYQALPQLNVYDQRGRLAHTFTTTAPLDSVKLFLR